MSLFPYRLSKMGKIVFGLLLGALVVFFLGAWLLFKSFIWIFDLEIEQERLASLHEVIEFPRGVDELRVLVGSERKLSEEEQERITLLLTAGGETFLFPEQDQHGFDWDQRSANWVQSRGQAEEVKASYMLAWLSDLHEYDWNRLPQGSELELELIIEGEAIEGLSLWVDTLD